MLSFHFGIYLWYVRGRRFPVSLCMHTHSYAIRIFRYFLQQSVLHSSVFTQHTHANTRIIRAAAAKLARYEIRNKPIPWFVNTQATHKQQLLYVVEVKVVVRSMRTRKCYDLDLQWNVSPPPIYTASSYIYIATPNTETPHNTTKLGTTYHTYHTYSYIAQVRLGVK